MELNKIITGLVFMILIVTGVLLFFSSGVTTYGVTGYNDSSLNKTLEKFNDINDMSNSTASKLQAISNPSASIYDKIGAFFGSGYEALKVTGTSFIILNDIVGYSAESLSGVGGSYIATLRVMIPIIILIIIFVGIFLHVVTKSDRV